MKLIWSPQSLEDRKQIYAFIFEHDPQAAEEMDASFNRQALGIVSFPNRGKAGRVSGTRELVVHKHYVIVYSWSEDFINIIAVLHTSRRYPA